MEPLASDMQRLNVNPAAAGPRRSTSPAPPSEAPEIQASEILLFDELGKGCFGAVYKGSCRGKEVAVKKLFRQTLDAATISAFKREVAVMTSLRHPNVCLLMGACTQPGYLALVTELCSNGDLYDLLHSKRPLSLPVRLQIAHDIALGMNWLHCSRPPVLHRDLKPKNILFDANMVVKLCDFGLSKQLDPADPQNSERGGLQGTPLWMAPEVLLARPVDTKCDVYSYAIVFWEILTRQEPFEDVTDYRTFKRMICKDDERPPLPHDIDADLRQLICDSWAREPSQRPTFAEILARLRPIIVHVALNDDRAFRFWHSNFQDATESVPFETFAKALSTEFGLPDPATNPDMRCLAEMLGERSPTHPKQLVVRVEGLGNLIAWFGPFEKTMLSRLVDVMRRPWFHGLVSKEDAESMLTSKPEGSFLVRLSSTSPGCYTISKVSRNNRINHQRLEFSPQRGFSLQVQLPSGAVQDVRAQESLDMFLSRIKDDLFLKIPVENDRFKRFFDHTSSDGYLYTTVDV